MRRNWRDREENFDRKKGMPCFLCGSLNHPRYSYPELKKAAEKNERVNQLPKLDKLDQIGRPFLNRGILNGKKMKIFRDTRTSLDLISANDVTKEQYVRKLLLVKQPHSLLTVINSVMPV